MKSYTSFDDVFKDSRQIDESAVLPRRKRTAREWFRMLWIIAVVSVVILIVMLLVLKSWANAPDYIAITISVSCAVLFFGFITALKCRQ